MAYQHFFEPRALKEYIKAFNWYKKRSHLAAANFVKKMDDAATASVFTTALS